MGNVIDFKKEKAKIEQNNKASCPLCCSENNVCPEWIFEISPADKEFENLPFDKILEWLYHTRHLA